MKKPAAKSPKKAKKERVMPILLLRVSLFIFHQYDFQTYVSNRSQCFKSHGMFDFAYKLQLHYNIYRLVFAFWMVKIIKVKIPLVS